MHKIDKADNGLSLAKSTKSHKYKRAILATARDPFHRFNYDERDIGDASCVVDRKSVGVRDVYQNERWSHCKAGQRLYMYVVSSAW